MTELIFKHADLVKMVLKEHLHHMNPYLNIREYLLQQNQPEDETDLWFWISQHPSNFAVRLMNQNIHKINPHGLVVNTNPSIEPLLEKTMHKFKPSDWAYLCKSSNPAVMSFLKKHPNRIVWSELSANQYAGAIEILENNLGKVVWWILSSNPAAIKIIEENMQYVDIYSLFKNPNAIHLIEQHIEQANDTILESLSCNPNAIHLLRDRLDKVSRFYLNRNPSSIPLLESNPHLINFDELVTNPNGIQLLEQHIEAINLHQAEEIVYNPSGIELFQRLFEIDVIPEEDFEYLVKERLIENPSLFDLDYQAMSKARVRVIYHELVAKAFHPDKVEKWLNHYLDQGGKIEDFDYV
jgi:hypothetical protein